MIWTGGSAWMADTGKRSAPGIAARLNPAGYAVAGVSIRSSSQVKFPGQLHGIRAAIRWLRANSAKYGLDGNRIAIMILHSRSDPLVPHSQGERLYMALNKACREAIFISLPTAGHGPWNGFLTDDAIRAAATIQTTSAAECAVTTPTPFTPTWQTVIDFLGKHLDAKRPATP